MDKRQDNIVWQEDLPSAAQHEDAALKTTMRFFAEELLPYFGIEGKVASLAPTELVHLEIKKLFQDFNLIMEDGSWKHFEFQSKNEGIKGMKRFRSYEALASYQNEVPVTTYVLFSGTMKDPMSTFSEGINTYRIIPIIMQDLNADDLIGQLQYKVDHGITISRDELVQLTLCPLMGGKKTQKERIQDAYAITMNAADIDPEEVRKVEAVIYAMADKFLETMDLEEIMEEMAMTRLGRMLVKEGIEEGIEKGIVEGTHKTKLEAARNLIDVLDEHMIAERIGLPLETVRELKKEYLTGR